MADKQTEDILEKALRLLRVIKLRTENTNQPVFLTELLQDLNMQEGEGQGAFRYLAGKRWIDTFKMPYAGRVNASGHDVLREVDRHLTSSTSQSASIRRSSDKPMEWDIFISHASEDKEEFVRPLAERLRQHGLRVWFDEFTLTVGDSLRRSIDRGLAQSRYGIVVISPNFLKKEWPQKELDGLVAREIEGVKVILPVWHGIGAEQIRAYSPTLADRLAARSDRGVDDVTSQLFRAIEAGEEQPSPQSSVPAQEPVRPAQIGSRVSGSEMGRLREYASEFHGRRFEQILTKPPVDLQEGGTLVMHVIPFESIGERASGAFEEISRNAHYFPPIGTTHARDMRINYDGLITGANAEGLARPQRAYVHVLRSGAVEAVDTSLGSGRDHEYIPLPQLQAAVIKFAYVYARSLRHFGVRPPIAVLVSLAKVGGLTLLQDFIGNALPFDLPGEKFDRDQYHFGEAIFESIPAEYNQSAKMLKPILIHLANAAGLHSSPYFDSDGNYSLVSKL